MASGIKKRSNSDYSDGRPGRINYGAEDEYRTIRMTVESNAYDMHDIAHLRDSINELFDGEFYIREKRIMNVQVEYESPGQKTGELQLPDTQYVNGKQIYVAHVGSIEIEDTTLTSTFTVELETVELPYFESIYTTLQLNDTGFDANAEKYGLVDNIDDEKTQYRFTKAMPTGNLIPYSNTSTASNVAHWFARGTNSTMNSYVQNTNFLLVQTTNSGSYLGAESKDLTIDLVSGETYTLTYFAQGGAPFTDTDYNWLIRSGSPNIKLPKPTETRNVGIRTGTTYYHRYDIVFTASFSGSAKVLIGGNLPAGSSTFIYFSYPRLYAGDVRKEWQEPMTPDQYAAEPSTFTVYNAGNVTVEPESMFLNIRLRNMSSFGNMKIRNKTTGEEHIYYPVFATKRHYHIDGLNVTSATTQVFRDTNRKFISLVPGDNEFEISGCTFDSAWFDFKNYYK